MSVEGVLWAFRQHECKPTERFVLVALGDRANHEGVCWPSYSDLAWRTGYSERRCQQAISTLVRYGLIERVLRRGKSGRQTSSLYVLHYERGTDIGEIGRRLKRVAQHKASLPRGNGQGEIYGDMPVDNSHEGDAIFRPVENTKTEQKQTVTEPQGEQISPLESNTNNPKRAHRAKTSASSADTPGVNAMTEHPAERPCGDARTRSASGAHEEVRHGRERGIETLRAARKAIGHPERNGGST